MSRTDIPPSWDERTMLTTFLDYVRATVHAKCEQLAEDDHGPWTDKDPVHLVEETARHNGHLDILRELADGMTGT